jgi:hypothetical protein
LTLVTQDGAISATVFAWWAVMAGCLSIEHEDIVLSREEEEGVRKSVELLKNAALSEASDFKPQAIQGNLL